jgi:hypothetical protein
MRKNKGILGLALLALLAFTITATVGASASVAGGSAVAAKKKCKKKKHAVSAKKKRCKKRKNFPPVSVVRASVTATQVDTANFDVDLFVFDAQGLRAGNGTDAIPASDLSPDIVGPGTETFTDLNASQHRPFSFGVCYAVGGSAHTTFTITYVTSDGVSHTDTRDAGDTGNFDYPADGVAIPSGYCPPNPF